MANSELPNEPERLYSRQARDEVQLILGQIHGVVWLAVNDVDHWLDKVETMDTNEPELNAEDIRKAGAEIHNHFGTLHAALNTGEFDDKLVRVGLAGAQGQAKRKGLLPSIRHFFDSKTKSLRNYTTRLRSSLRWSNTLIGSITAALEGEIERVPGAATAGEAIKEFIEVLLNATEPKENDQEVSGTQPKSKQ